MVPGYCYFNFLLSICDTMTKVFTHLILNFFSSPYFPQNLRKDFILLLPLVSLLSSPLYFWKYGPWWENKTGICLLKIWKKKVLLNAQLPPSLSFSFSLSSQLNWALKFHVKFQKLDQVHYLLLLRPCNMLISVLSQFSQALKFFLSFKSTQQSLKISCKSPEAWLGSVLFAFKAIQDVDFCSLSLQFIWCWYFDL